MIKNIQFSCFIFATLVAALLLALPGTIFATHNPAHEIRDGKFENEEPQPSSSATSDSEQSDETYAACSDIRNDLDNAEDQNDKPALQAALEKCEQIIESHQEPFKSNDPDPSIKGEPGEGKCDQTVTAGDVTYTIQSGIKLSVPDSNGNDCVPFAQSGVDQDNNPIYVYLRTILRFLSGIIILLSVLFITISGVQYAASSGNPEAVKAAKKRIFNALTGLFLYIFMTAILNFLVPGGIL